MGISLYQKLKNLTLQTWIRLLSQIFLIFLALSLAFSILFPKRWLLMDNIRLYIQRHIITVISDFRYTYQIDKIADTASLLSKKNLAVGDLIFTSENSSLWSAFIDGKRKHVLIYLWTQSQRRILLSRTSPLYLAIQKLNFPDQTPLILEARFDGVQIKPLSSLPDSESLLAIRPVLSKKALKAWLDQLSSAIGKPYDFDFDTEESSALYCSELLAPVLHIRGFQIMVEDWILRDVISPNALIRSLLLDSNKKNQAFMLFYIDMKDGALRYQSRKTLENSLLH